MAVKTMSAEVLEELAAFKRQAKVIMSNQDEDDAKSEMQITQAR